MRRLVPLSAVLVFAVAALSHCAGDRAPQKVLYLTQSMGYKHEVLPLSEKILVEVGQKHGFAVTVSGDASAISAESLKPYFAVVFYTTGELPMKDEQKAALMAWIRAGHGFVGIHSATDTFYKWPEYGEMIGGYFDEHPWNTQVTMKVEDHGHPSTKHLGATWTVADEIYQFKNYSRGDKHVLLSLDVASVDLTAKGVKRADRDFANAWYKSWGSGPRLLHRPGASSRGLAGPGVPAARCRRHLVGDGRQVALVAGADIARGLRGLRFPRVGGTPDRRPPSAVSNPANRTWERRSRSCSTPPTRRGPHVRQAPPLRGLRSSTRGSATIARPVRPCVSPRDAVGRDGAGQRRSVPRPLTVAGDEPSHGWGVRRHGRSPVPSLAPRTPPVGTAAAVGHRGRARGERVGAGPPRSRRRDP